jgi:hypothetical protein
MVRLICFYIACAVYAGTFIVGIILYCIPN